MIHVWSDRKKKPKQQQPWPQCNSFTRKDLQMDKKKRSTPHGQRHSQARSQRVKHILSLDMVSAYFLVPQKQLRDVSLGVYTWKSSLITCFPFMDVSHKLGCSNADAESYEVMGVGRTLVLVSCKVASMILSK